MSRILVAEKVAEAGLSRLREHGHEVVDLSGAPREKLLAELSEADALQALLDGDRKKGRP